MRKKLSNLSEEREISIRLEQYDDIFSDFDMRPYGKRALSADFLDEIKRASVDKDIAGVELFLCVPEKERNESDESTIRERLVAHFSKHYKLLKKEKRSVLKRGMLMVFIGMAFMVVATLMVHRGDTNNILLTFLALKT